MVNGATHLFVAGKRSSGFSLPTDVDSSLSLSSSASACGDVEEEGDFNEDSNDDVRDVDTEDSCQDEFDDAGVPTHDATRVHPYSDMVVVHSTAKGFENDIVAGLKKVPYMFE